MTTALRTRAADVEFTSELILRFLLPHQRTEDAPGDTTSAAAQLRAIAHFVDRGEPITFSLPAFPCKSPNPRKVLGHLPDLGELLSLRFLHQLCEQVARVYEPGARMLICSDGHVFGDLIGVDDAHIEEYAAALHGMIQREQLSTIDSFDLRDVYGNASYDQKRDRLMREFGEPLEALREEVRRDEHTQRLYRGITRFLVEDTAGWNGTRSALQRQSRQRAYGVIARSRAWGALIERHHPTTVRLSIHPQPTGAAKFGVRLLEARDAWLTPWHSVAVLGTDGRYTLLPRAEAERIGELVSHDGRPSHFVITSPQAAWALEPVA